MDDLHFIATAESRPIAAADPRAQWEEKVARFCFAAARLPSPVVEGFLELIETYEDSQWLTSNGEKGHA